MILFGKLRIERYTPPQPRDGHLRCEDCGALLHRGERFTMLTVRHNDCKDTRGTGQMTLPMEGES
jgi:hypothetical protein